MKKIFIATVLAATSFVASALEVGVHGNRDYASDRNAVGVTLSNKVGPLRASLMYDRTVSTANDQNRFGVGASYDVFSMGPVKVSAKVGAHYLDNNVGSDGMALTAGAGFTVPVVAKKIDAVVDVTRQYGQSRVKAHDGNRVSMGLVYKF